jgi:uncharacterized protein (DUF2267 family)
MSMTGLATFDDTIHTTNRWLAEICENLNWSERGLALKALRTVLHMLRDRLPLHLSAHFSAQLPMLVRGLYFEGWTGAPTDLKDRSLEHFLEPVKTAFAHYPSVEAETVTLGVFDIIRLHISEGETVKILHALPQSLRDLLDQPLRVKPQRGL